MSAHEIASVLGIRFDGAVDYGDGKFGGLIANWTFTKGPAKGASFNTRGTPALADARDGMLRKEQQFALNAMKSAESR